MVSAAACSPEARRRATGALAVPGMDGAWALILVFAFILPAVSLDAYCAQGTPLRVSEN